MVYEFCKKNNLDYDLIYRDATETYNQGYTAMNMRHVRRPVLHHSEGEIGGHCIIPNLDLFDFPANEIIKKQNSRFKMRGVSKSVRKSSKRSNWRRRD